MNRFSILKNTLQPEPESTLWIISDMWLHTAYIFLKYVNIYMKETCRDDLGPGHSMKVCGFKANKLDIFTGNLLFYLFDD